MAKVINGELASGFRLMLGANGVCTCTGGRARHTQCTCGDDCTRGQVDVFVVLGIIVTVGVLVPR